MPKKEINWTKLVKAYGYPDIRKMLADMYVEQNISPHIMALKLGCSVSTLQRKLSELGIRRGRGNIPKTWGTHGF